MAFRTIGKVSLADAIEVHAEAMARPGTVLVAGVDRLVAEHIAATFADRGIKALIQPSSMTVPMICKPRANVAYRLNAARVLMAVEHSNKPERN